MNPAPRRRLPPPAYLANKLRHFLLVRLGHIRLPVLVNVRAQQPAMGTRCAMHVEFWLIRASTHVVLPACLRATPKSPQSALERPRLPHEHALLRSFCRLHAEIPRCPRQTPFKEIQTSYINTHITRKKNRYIRSQLRRHCRQERVQQDHRGDVGRCPLRRFVRALDPLRHLSLQVAQHLPLRLHVRCVLARQHKEETRPAVAGPVFVSVCACV